MFNKFALVVTGLMLAVSSVGCCCLHGAGYGAGYRPMGCPPCNSCPPAGGGYYQQGAFYQGDMTTQTAYVSGVSQTAMVPVQSAALPTTTAAALPGAIQGPPIYTNTAVLPGAALPAY